MYLKLLTKAGMVLKVDTGTKHTKKRGRRANTYQYHPNTPQARHFMEFIKALKIWENKDMAECYFCKQNIFEYRMITYKDKLVTACLDRCEAENKERGMTR